MLDEPVLEPGDEVVTHGGLGAWAALAGCVRRAGPPAVRDPAGRF